MPPLYDYKCPKCQVTREFLDSAQNEVHVCITCPNGTHIDRQISVANFQFKGTGFYTTDYKGKS